MPKFESEGKDHIFVRDSVLSMWPSTTKKSLEIMPLRSPPHLARDVRLAPRTTLKQASRHRTGAHINPTASACWFHQQRYFR